MFRVLIFVLLAFCLSGCGDKAKMGENPFFEESWDTPYGAPPFDRIDISHFKPALEEGMVRHKADIEAIVNSAEEPTFENVILAYNNSGNMLWRVGRVFSLLNSAHTSDELQALSSEMMPLLAAHGDAITMNDALFAKIQTVYNLRFSLNLNAVQMRLTEQIYDDFVRSGALLSPADKSRLKQINERLSMLSVSFANNLLAETNAFVLEVPRARLNGVPQSVRDAAEAQAKEMEKKGFVFTLHTPSMIPLLTYADDRSLREEIYKAYISRGDNGNEYDNNAIITEIVSLRAEKAKLLGFKSFAHYVTARQMAGSPDAVYELLEGVWTPALETAKDELERMKQLFKKDNGTDAEFASWDWWYYAEKVRQRDYQLEEASVREYLSLDNVKGGVFFLANRLYGISFRPISAPLYHEECEVYEVKDSNDEVLGLIYFDFHPRASKRGGAWCGTYTPQRYDNGKRIAPVVTVVCNFTRPTESRPALLSLDEAETLFHEFGHALHVLFAEVPYRGLSEVEGDFVELPSQIMENWAFSKEMLKKYAIHYRRSEVMPDSMIEKIHRAAKFNEGFATTELVAAALSDLDIHSLESVDESFNLSEFQDKVLREKRGLIPQIEPRYRYTYFNHIFNGSYSAGYYFYIWAEVLDKDAFEAFVESGDLFNTEIAQRFRKEILSKGGTRPGMEMYRAFRGADPDKDALLRARGFIEEDVQPIDSLPAPEIEVERIDTRELARQRAEKSRREREAAEAAEAAAKVGTSNVAEKTEAVETVEKVENIENIEKIEEVEEIEKVEQAEVVGNIEAQATANVAAATEIIDVNDATKVTESAKTSEIEKSATEIEKSTTEVEESIKEIKDSLAM